MSNEKSGGRFVLGAGAMTKRCRSCNDGIVVLLGAGGRVESTCTCARGIERAGEKAQEKLRSELLAAFHASDPRKSPPNE